MHDRLFLTARLGALHCPVDRIRARLSRLKMLTASILPLRYRIGRFTPIYLALINPLRKLIACPSLLRSVGATWVRTFG